MRREKFRTGKLPQDVLSRLLAKAKPSDPRVLLGPKIGEDAAVINFGETYLIAKTDPITFATEEIGWYAVQVNANDVATKGAAPKWFLATVLLPEEAATEQLATEIFDQIHQACRELEIELVGGHMEITYDLPRPIVVGQMLAEVPQNQLKNTADAKIGDYLVLTKGIPIEGASIIAREREELLLSRGFEPALLKKAANFLRNPGISVVKEALCAAQVPGVHAMHDPTEGGLATGLHEIALAAKLSILVEESKIPLLEEATALCSAFGLDPLGVIASGALLISTAPESVESLLFVLTESGIPAQVIGQVTEDEFGVQIKRSSGEIAPLPRFDSDEITKIFS